MAHLYRDPTDALSMATRRFRAGRVAEEGLLADGDARAFAATSRANRDSMCLPDRLVFRHLSTRDGMCHPLAFANDDANDECCRQENLAIVHNLCTLSTARRFLFRSPNDVTVGDGQDQYPTVPDDVLEPMKVYLVRFHCEMHHTYDVPPVPYVAYDVPNIGRRQTARVNDATRMIYGQGFRLRRDADTFDALSAGSRAGFRRLYRETVLSLTYDVGDGFAAMMQGVGERLTDDMARTRNHATNAVLGPQGALSPASWRVVRSLGGRASFEVPAGAEFHAAAFAGGEDVYRRRHLRCTGAGPVHLAGFRHDHFKSTVFESDESVLPAGDTVLRDWLAAVLDGMIARIQNDPDVAGPVDGLTEMFVYSMRVGDAVMSYGDMMITIMRIANARGYLHVNVANLGREKLWRFRVGDRALELFAGFYDPRGFHMSVRVAIPLDEVRGSHGDSRNERAARYDPLAKKTPTDRVSKATMSRFGRGSGRGGGSGRGSESGSGRVPVR